MIVEAPPTQWPDKNPADVLDFTADFTDFLEAAELITSRTVTVPGGITKDSDSITSDSKKITVWLSSGTSGNSYEVSVSVGTNSSPARTVKRYWSIRVVEKL